MANVVVGSLVANEIFPTQAFNAGAASFGPLAVPAGFTVLMVSFDLRSVTDLLGTFTGQVDISFDNGTTWQSAGSAAVALPVSGYVLSGSTIVRSATDPLGPGAPVRVFALRFMLTQAQLSTRQIRGTLSCNENTTSGATIAAW